MNKENYNKILEVTELNYRKLDEHTLLFDDIVIGTELIDNEEKEIYLNIEVFTDENNALKICEIHEDDGEFISIEDVLSEEYYNHIKKLVEKSINNNIKELENIEEMFNRHRDLSDMFKLEKSNKEELNKRSWELRKLLGHTL
ncbi:hypothetical protein [Mammaliicoccus sciuri]|uniref:hypothetical protein n=1 Tax=Mammaliicoccus sciuri TaxID=1296 RepID=UPI0021CF6662|nr:hypothetical protein [Mammaliicoccus sciuri]UXU70146.1 hypothetical protein MUA36_05555 [Mammaliicoccus sciuri]